MKRLTNIIYLLGILGIVGGVAGLKYIEQDREDEIAFIAEEVRRFEQVIKLHAATEGVELTGRGWPKTINPEWFPSNAPTNSLLSPDRPWVEVATPDEAQLLHPNNRIASDSTDSMFWYNPYQGVIRTRVPPSISDNSTLQLYNRLNRTALPSIFASPESLQRDADVTAPDEDSTASDDESASKT